MNPVIYKIVLASVLMASAALADTYTTKKGKVLENAVVTERGKGWVKIKHSGGVGKFRLRDFPEDQRNQLSESEVKPVPKMGITKRFSEPVYASDMSTASETWRAFNLSSRRVIVDYTDAVRKTHSSGVNKGKGTEAYQKPVYGYDLTFTIRNYTARVISVHAEAGAGTQSYDIPSNNTRECKLRAAKGVSLRLHGAGGSQVLFPSY